MSIGRKHHSTIESLHGSAIAGGLANGSVATTVRIELRDGDTAELPGGYKLTGTGHAEYTFDQHGRCNVQLFGTFQLAPRTRYWKRDDLRNQADSNGFVFIELFDGDAAWAPREGDTPHVFKGTGKLRYLFDGDTVTAEPYDGGQFEIVPLLRSPLSSK